jgi:DNA polymerase V
MRNQIDPADCIPPDWIVKATSKTHLAIPFFASYVQAGFPSPADNYIEKSCDLNELCISNQSATYFVRVGSDSLSGDRIERGDILVVDCSKEPVEGKIVVVWLNGQLAVKRIQYAAQMVVLLPSNPQYSPIYVHSGDEFKVLGVVTYVLQKKI